MSVICDDLRAAILQAAMTGKLTEQLDSDDDSEIIKNEILNERSAYKECKFLENIEDDVAFPDTWQYLRAGEVFELTTGDKILKGDKMPLMDAKYFRGKQTSYTDKGNLANSGDVLILVDGENSGEVFLCSESGYMGSTFKKLFIPKCINKDFALYFLEMNRRELRENKRGAAIPHLDKKVFFNFILPIPPLAEQKRIVGKIDELMARVADLEKSADALASLKKSFPSDVRDALLQAAMQGKLTEQLPEDGDAGDLLERIKVEKEKLVVEGKIKKQKPLAPIAEDEIPFEIPENWRWVRLWDLFQFINGDRGKNYPSKDKLYASGEIPFISAINMYNGTVRKDNLLYADKMTYDRLGSGKLNENDFAICIRGSLGKYCKYPYKIGAIASSLVIMRKYSELILDDYIDMYLRSPLLVSEIHEKNNGTAQPNLSAAVFASFLIPIPPLAEQKRIADCLNSLISNINTIEGLTASE